MSVIREEFQVHMLNDDGKAKARALAEAFSGLLTELESIVPAPCREMSLVKTHLETASYYAKRAMASRPENQEPSK